MILFHSSLGWCTALMQCSTILLNNSRWDASQKSLKGHRFAWYNLLTTCIDQTYHGFCIVVRQSTGKRLKVDDILLPITDKATNVEFSRCCKSRWSTLNHKINACSTALGSSVILRNSNSNSSRGSSNSWTGNTLWKHTRLLQSHFSFCMQCQSLFGCTGDCQEHELAWLDEASSQVQST